MPLVGEQHFEMLFLRGCFLLGRHTVNIPFLIIITVLGIAVVWSLPVFTHQSGVIHNLHTYCTYVWVLVADCIHVSRYAVSLHCKELLYRQMLMIPLLETC